jgi:hypothetical protein
VLAGLFMVMPFVAVSCDAPGGFGRAAPGGTTTYTGVDLVTGGHPTVAPPDRLRAVAARRDDGLGAQPLAVAATLLIVAGIAAARVSPAIRRRAAVAQVALAAAVFLIADQVTVRALLESRLREQLTVPMPAGKRAGDYVHDQPGFWLSLAALLAVALANGIGWFRLHRAAPAAVVDGAAGPYPGPAPDSSDGPTVDLDVVPGPGSEFGPNLDDLLTPGGD